MTKGLFILRESAFDLIYGHELAHEIKQHVDIYAPPQTAEAVRDNPALLHDAEVIFSGWGGPYLDETLLNAAPNLKIVFYGAGTIRKIVSEAFWDRGVRICSAWAANAVPVAEFTLGQILLSLKRTWHFAITSQLEGKHVPRTEVPGAYGSTVGIVSLGQIGRRVCKLLQPFDVRLIAYDPYTDPQTAAALGVELVSLDDVFQQADVVSLHAPNLPETRGLITGDHFASMKQDATFINTARGAIVREDEMIDVLRQRRDLYALLDVTSPEPPVPDSPLFALPNVRGSPHTSPAPKAGSAAAWADTCSRN